MRHGLTLRWFKLNADEKGYDSGPNVYEGVM